MKKSEYKSLANKIEFAHILIFFVTITAMVTIFASELLRIYSAIWLSGLWIVEKIYGNCPLTVREYKLRKKAGQKIKKTKFIPRFLKKIGDYSISAPKKLIIKQNYDDKYDKRCCTQVF